MEAVFVSGLGNAGGTPSKADYTPLHSDNIGATDPKLGDEYTGHQLLQRALPLNALR
jgi:hypothetical protein